MGDLARTIIKATAQDTKFAIKARSVSTSDSEDGSRIHVSKRLNRRLSGDRDLGSPPSAFHRGMPSTVSSSPIVRSPSMPVSPNLEIDDDKDKGKEGWSSVTSGFTNSLNNLIRLGSGMSESIGSIRVKGTDPFLL
jgi:hypothetical protein